MAKRSVQRVYPFERDTLFSLRSVNFLRALVSRNIRCLSLRLRLAFLRYYSLLPSTALHLCFCPATPLPRPPLSRPLRSVSLRLPRSLVVGMQIITRVLALISAAIPRPPTSVCAIVSSGPEADHYGIDGV